MNLAQNLIHLQLKKVTILFVKLQWIGISNSAEIDANKFASLVLIT